MAIVRKSDIKKAKETEEREAARKEERDSRRNDNDDGLGFEDEYENENENDEKDPPRNTFGINTPGAQTRLFTKTGGNHSAQIQGFIKIIKESTDQYDSTGYKLAAFPINKRSLPYASMGIAMKSPTSGVTAIGIIIFGGTLEGSPTFKVRVGRSDIEAPRISSSALDGELSRAAKEGAEMLGFGSDGSPVIVVGGMDLLDGLTDYSDETAETYLSGIGRALETFLLEGEEGYKDISFSSSGKSNVKLMVEVAMPYSNKVFDISQLPIRADYGIIFDVSTKGSGRRNYYENGGSDVTSEQLTSVVGYSSITMDDTTPVSGGFGAKVSPDEYRRFSKSFVISLMSSPSMTNGPIFLAATSAASLSGSSYDLEMLQPVMGGSGPDRDLGALNFLACLPTNNDDNSMRSSVGVPLDLSGGYEDVNNFVRAITAQGVAVKIEFTKCSGVACYLYDLDQLGSPSSSSSQKKQSKQKIWDSLITLTNGYIEDFFDPADPFLMASDPDRPSGYYINEDGDNMSTSEIDLLSVVTEFHDSNPDLIENYLRTLLDPELDPYESGAMLTEIYSLMTQGSVVITGTMVTRTFNPKLLEAIALALEESGVDLVMARSNKASSNWNGRKVGNTVVSEGIRDAFTNKSRRSSPGQRHRRQFLRS